MCRHILFVQYRLTETLCGDVAADFVLHVPCDRTYCFPLEMVSYSTASISFTSMELACRVVVAVTFKMAAHENAPEQIICQLHLDHPPEPPAHLAEKEF